MSTHTGTCKWFNTLKGYGFIEPDTGGKDVFVHIKELGKSKVSSLHEGDRVSFDLQDGRGKVSAVNLKVLAKVS